MVKNKTSIIRELKQENGALRSDNVRWQELYYATEDRLKGEKLQREFFERCFKSVKKRLSEKQELLATLNKEIACQYKRREKAEKILALVAESLRDFSEKVKAYE